ncbi:nucleolin [Betta splendens]|uniref:Nucleolin n=1 Tax=Betta splendens TaxID=158456 RepID=A0A6P7LJL7_BETSP|nr:nucleolin [Betta splendens]
MSKQKDIVRRDAPMPRIREQSSVTQTHESFADLINGRYPSRPFLDVLGFSYLRNYGARLQEDFFYSDDDDSDDDDDDDYFYPSRAAYSPLNPHPRIRQLTDEEADRHAKELIAEEERRKGKTERNKRKKMRKKERKRLEKENAIKENLPEKDQEKTETSENQVENPIIETNVDELSKTQNVPQAVGGDESCSNSKEETEKPNKKDVEPKETGVNNSYDSTPKLVSEETFNQTPVKEQKKKKNQQHKEEKPKTTGNMDVEKKNETKNEELQKTLDPTNEECAKRSRDLAAAGNRFAASGQYEIAVKCFTDAIKFNPKEFKLFGNRSLCYERMQQYENALRDADLTLCMEPGWTKGLFRKGKALCGLKKYYEASLVYTEVLKLDSSSAEAKQELKRAQMLHLMEMGFSREESLEALKTHATLEHAVEALFSRSPPAASSAPTKQPVEQDTDEVEGEWMVQQTSRSRAQQVKECEALSQSRSKSQSPTPPLSRSSVKADLISIWVGSLAPTVTYATLHELFSRVGVVYSIKMLLEHQCAFVNYTRKEDCDRAIQSFNGMVLEGSPLSVRYPSKTHTALSYKKECFFWRTTGCTRQDCTYKHVPEHKNIDRDKFTSRLGRFNV